MVYDTVVVVYDTECTDGPETVDIETTLDLVVDAKCLHVVRKVVIDARYRTSPFPGLNAVIERMGGAAGECAGVRKLELSLYAWGSEDRERNHPAADHEDEIASVSSALAALMPGLREIKFDSFQQAPIARALYGQLVGFYAGQLQVLHSKSPLVVPQDRVFARLRDARISVSISESVGVQLPRLDPEVVESLVLQGLAANKAWSTFCADPDGRAITFPRLINLDLACLSRDAGRTEQLSGERSWALQFPAAKHVRISCFDEECPTMKNAVFPNCLESLDISWCSSMLPVFAGRNVLVSRNLALMVMYTPDASDRSIDIANRMLAESNSHNMRKLSIHSNDEIMFELITFTGLTHLELNGSTNADVVMQIIHSLPHLEEFPGLAVRMLKYLLLRIPVLKSVTTRFVPLEQIQAFIDKYVRWYPHLANIKLMD
ncbi:hypothetical protein H4R19_001206 [Coemansia spiralis]|nr:hypothetical protein H4R19_001206 [Coemansia spiralis]